VVKLKMTSRYPSNYSTFSKHHHFSQEKSHNLYKFGVEEAFWRSSIYDLAMEG
jgi:hypothetical protein